MSYKRFMLRVSDWKGRKWKFYENTYLEAYKSGLRQLRYLRDKGCKGSSVHILDLHTGKERILLCFSDYSRDLAILPGTKTTYDAMKFLSRCRLNHELAIIERRRVQNDV